MTKWSKQKRKIIFQPLLHGLEYRSAIWCLLWVKYNECKDIIWSKIDISKTKVSLSQNLHGHISLCPCGHTWTHTHTQANSVASPFLQNPYDFYNFSFGSPGYAIRLQGCNLGGHQNMFYIQKIDKRAREPLKAHGLQVF